VAGSVKTDAIVLRSIRYGEADRVLHLYTPGRGRVGAIAKGVRRATSRFGGRLEPFFHLRLVLHEGRGDLLTVTSAETVAPHARLRDDRAGLDTAARACDAVARLFEADLVLHRLRRFAQKARELPLQRARRNAGHRSQLRNAAALADIGMHRFQHTANAARQRRRQRSFSVRNQFGELRNY